MFEIKSFFFKNCSSPVEVKIGHRSLHGSKVRRAVKFERPSMCTRTDPAAERYARSCNGERYRRCYQRGSQSEHDSRPFVSVTVNSHGTPIGVGREIWAKVFSFQA